MSALADALCEGPVLLMDGAMGTELQRAGIQEGECYEAWNLNHPERVLNIHRAYVAAGARVLLTNTLQANPDALRRHGLAHRLHDIFQAGIVLARHAVGQSGFVLADIGPHASADSHNIQPNLDSVKGADGIVLETWSDPGTAANFVHSLRNAANIPVLVSFTFQRTQHDGKLRTFKDFTPRQCAQAAYKIDATALGVNCGKDLGLKEYLEILEEYRALGPMPLFVKPNAGTPRRIGEQWKYPIAPTDIADWVEPLLQFGVRMIGGCCGTTPAHIAAMRRAVDDRSKPRGTT